MTPDPTPPPAPGAGVSERWAAWRRVVDLDEYEARWERLAGQGDAVHGEVELVMSFSPRRVLDAGCGTGRVGAELAGRGVDVVGVDLDPDLLAVARRRAPGLDWRVDDLATMQLDQQFDLVVMAGNVPLFCRPEDRRVIVHTLAGHLEPGGLLVAGFTVEPDGYGPDDLDADAAASGLELVERWSTWDRAPYDDQKGYQVSVHRRVEHPGDPLAH